MTIPKSRVVISRQWDNPQIQIEIRQTGIQIGMSLSDFITALSQEMGTPATILTQKQLLGRLTAAAELVTEGMKATTTRVM